MDSLCLFDPAKVVPSSVRKRSKVGSGPDLKYEAWVSKFMDITSLQRPKDQVSPEGKVGLSREKGTSGSTRGPSEDTPAVTRSQTRPERERKKSAQLEGKLETTTEVNGCVFQLLLPMQDRHITGRLRFSNGWLVR